MSHNQLTGQVGLDARNVNRELVLVATLHVLAAISEMVVAGDVHNVGQDVISLNDEVTDDNVNVSAGELNVGDGDVADALNDLGDDNIAKISEQVWLELRLAIFVLAQIREELVHGLCELLVERIIVKLVAEELDLIEKSVAVVLVAITEEEVALVVQFVPLFSGLIFHDETLLLQALANVGVEVFKEPSELWVLVGITVDGIDSVKQVIHGGVVGETFEDNLQVCQRWTTRVKST